jgi:ABC-2 type transport system ATP-binding protein
VELNPDSALSFLSLTFGWREDRQPLFKEFSLDVPAGARFGLFGPNGAGKTTLIRIATGLIPNKNSVRIFGRIWSRETRSLFGFIPQEYGFYPELTARENLHFFGAWSGLTRKETLARTEELLTVLSLNEAADKQVRKYSGGMKRRVNLAIGVIHKPRLLFLDEPTVGVDVHTRHAIIAHLLQLNREGTTLFYTSHQMAEAQELCDRVALMDNGKIIASDTVDALLAAHGEAGLESLFLTLTGRKLRD